MPMDRKLYVAAKEGDEKVVEEYKDQFATQLTPYTNTVLHVAAQYSGFSLEDSAKFLDMVGPELLFSLNSNGDTCIHLAASLGDVKFIEASISLAKKCGGPGDIEAGIPKYKELLRIANKDGDTALHLAIMGCHHSVVELLVKEDAEFPYPPNKAGKSPLYLAVEDNECSSVGLILDKCNSLSYAGPYGTTVLHAAATHKDAGSMDSILKKEPSLTKQVDDFGWNPVHFAAYLGHKLPVKTLLMADKHMAYETIKDENKTPLHVAVIKGKPDVMEEILEQCPDSLEAVTSQGQNALHLAKCSKVKDLIFYKRHGYLNLNRQRDVDGNMPDDSERNNMLFHPYLEKFNSIDDVHSDWLLDYKTWIKERTEVCKERANTHILVATLITTVSFAAGFTLPGGYDSDDGPNKGNAILWKKAAFQAFAVTDTIAMISSTSAVFLLYLVTYERGHKRRLNHYVAAGSLVMVAIVAMMIAFMSGLYAVLPSTSLAIFICVICSLSLALFIFILCKSLYEVVWGA